QTSVTDDRGATFVIPVCPAIDRRYDPAGRLSGADDRAGRFSGPVCTKIQRRNGRRKSRRLIGFFPERVSQAAQQLRMGGQFIFTDRKAAWFTIDTRLG